MPFQLPQLSYAFDALEPYIDARTMELHYTKHHQAYITNVNTALETYPALQQVSVVQLLQTLDTVPESIRQTVRNNGGGHYNHTLFWQMMASGGIALHNGQLKTALEKSFGSVDEFKNRFSMAAKSLFGSGWVWLVVDGEGVLRLESTPNQDSPIMHGSYPILGLDVWEHAYYLKYQNRRVDYIQAWWSVVNWDFVNDSFNALV